MNAEEVPEDECFDVDCNLTHYSTASPEGERFFHERTFGTATPLLDAVLAKQREITEAKARVESFLDAWVEAPSRDNHIYGLGVHREENSRDLTVSDLRLLLSAVRL